MSTPGGLIKESWTNQDAEAGPADYRRYLDSSFGRNDESLSKDPKDLVMLRSLADDGRIHWERLPSVFAKMKGVSEKDYRRTAYSMFPRSHEDTNQGAPFILETLAQPTSLLSILSLRPSEGQFVTDWLSVPLYALQLHDRLKKNVIDYDLQKGVFIILLTEMLQKRIIIVDDYIPYIIRERQIVPLCTINSNLDYACIPIFEKAIAKLRGSYRDILRYDAGHGMLYLNQYSQTAIILQINRKDQQWNLLRKVLETPSHTGGGVKQLVVFTLCYRIHEFNQTGDEGSHNYLALAMCEIHPQSEGPTGDEYEEPSSTRNGDWNLGPGDVSHHSVTCFALKCVSGGQDIPHDKLKLRKNSKAYRQHCGYLDAALNNALSQICHPDITGLNPSPHARDDFNYLDGIFWITWPEINRYMGAYFIVDLTDDARYDQYYSQLPPLPKDHFHSGGSESRSKK